MSDRKTAPIEVQECFASKIRNSEYLITARVHIRLSEEEFHAFGDPTVDKGPDRIKMIHTRINHLPFPLQGTIEGDYALILEDKVAELERQVVYLRKMLDRS
jgi:hypothetical protein